MSPEERQLLQGLFDRMRSSAGTSRDGEAEQMIADNVRQQPYAPYLLAQTVIVQDQALQAANQRMQQMEQELQQRSSSQPSGGGSFLSSIFGGGQRQEPPPPSRPVWNQGSSYPQQGGYPPQGGYAPGGYPQGGYAPPPPQQGGPWGGGMSSGGGSFLQGALGTAAGVAGGVLLADSIKGLFSGGHGANSLGIANGVPGVDSGSIMGPDVVNNYYGDSGGTAADYRQDADQDQDAAQDAADYGGSDGRTAADWQQDADQDMDDADDGSSDT